MEIVFKCRCGREERFGVTILGNPGWEQPAGMSCRDTEYNLGRLSLQSAPQFMSFRFYTKCDGAVLAQ